MAILTQKKKKNSRQNIYRFDDVAPTFVHSLYLWFIESKKRNSPIFRG